jgi:hypothetical protein
MVVEEPQPHFPWAKFAGVARDVAVQIVDIYRESLIAC